MSAADSPTRDDGRPSRPHSVRREAVGERFERGGAAAMIELCELFQRAAGEHAERLGCSIELLQERELTWVVLRLEIEIEPSAVWLPPLEVTTWPSAQRGIFAMRDYLAHGGGGPIARATSAWCVLDLARRRPVRLPPFIRSIVAPERPRALERRFVRPPAPRQVDATLAVRVADDDLDLNRHANHLRYIDWALATLPDGWREGRYLVGLDAEFQAEARLGERLVGEVERVPGESRATEGRHRIVGPGGREIARVRSRWRQPDGRPLP